MLFGLEDANDDENEFNYPASQMNKNTRANCEQYCMELKKVIECDVDSIHIDEDVQEKDTNSLPSVLNP